MARTSRPSEMAPRRLDLHTKGIFPDGLQRVKQLIGLNSEKYLGGRLRMIPLFTPSGGRTPGPFDLDLRLQLCH
jgi:hypothetical protein